MNALKEKIKAGKKIYGAHLVMGESYVADIYGRLDYDYIWIDTEHSAIDYDRLLNCITILKAHKMPVIVRVQLDNYNHTKKVLEMGPDGIIFPMVDTPEYADKCIASTLYPPLGNRGSGPMGAIAYGVLPMSEYVADQVDNLCRFVQVESKTAVENLEKIAQNPYIDGFIIGPYDMSGSIGRLGDVECKENVDLIEKTIKYLKSQGKMVGVSMTSIEIEDQKRWLDRGIDMLSSGADFDYIVQLAKKNSAQLRALVKEYQD